MAQKKTTTTKKSGGSTKSAASKASKSSGTSSRAKKTAPPAKKPIRREVGGAVLLVLTLCTLISYFGVSAIFLDALAGLLKGLFGYGYYLAAPAMGLAGCILLNHHGRPVQLRVTCTLLSPAVLGILAHMLLCKETFLSLDGVVPALWKSGRAMTSGGVISGAIGEWSVAVFSKFASVILFGALLAVLFMIALKPTLEALGEKHRQRPRYEYEEEYEEEEDQLALPMEPQRRRQRIDIPLDGDLPPAIPQSRGVPKKEGRFTSFFRHKSDQQRTPDQVLLDQSRSAAPASPSYAAENPIVEEPLRWNSSAIPTM